MKKLKMIAHILEPIVKEVLRAKRWSLARAAGVLALTGAVFGILKKVFHSVRKAGAITGCLVLIAALVACGSPAPEPVLSIGQTSYMLGTQKIVVQLSNPSDKEISYSSACWVESFHAAGTHGSTGHGHKIAWKTAPVSETLTIPAGESRDITVHLKDLKTPLAAGEYQLGVDVGDTPLYVAFVIA